MGDRAGAGENHVREAAERFGRLARAYPSSATGFAHWRAVSLIGAAMLCASGVVLVDARDAVAGFEFDQEMRWEAAIKAIAYGLPGADARLATEASRDHSDRGQRALIRADAARPSADAKAAAWARIHAEGYGSFHFTRAAMQGFVWIHQAQLIEPYGDRFFEAVRDVFDLRPGQEARVARVRWMPGQEDRGPERRLPLDDDVHADHPAARPAGT